MKWQSGLLTAFFSLTAISLTACPQQKIEACQIVEIEDAEVEVDVGDVDIERGEVEMDCGNQVVDVQWGEFRKKLKLDPGKYKTNIAGLSSEVNCFRDNKSKRKEVLCQHSGQNELKPLSFSYDD